MVAWFVVAREAVGQNSKLSLGERMGLDQIVILSFFWNSSKTFSFSSKSALTIF